MKIRIPGYKGGFRILSIALEESVKEDLMSEYVEELFVQQDLAVLYPDERILTENLDVLTRLKKMNNYDVIGISDNGMLYRYYDDSSNENAFFITEKCNSNCIMCPSPDFSRKRGSGIAIDDLITIASHIPSDTPHITITGGEPFMVGKRIFDLLYYCREKFLRTEFLILSNARIFAVNEYCLKLKETMPYNCIIGVPVHGSCSEIHDSLTRAHNSFNQTLTGLLRLQSLGIPIELRIVVCKANLKDLEALSRLITTRLSRANRVNIMAMEMTGNAYINAEKLWVPYRASFRYIKPAIENLVESGIDVGLYNFPLCTVDPEYRLLCAKSISSWKVRYAPVCDLCFLKESCGGVFAGSYKFESSELEAITV